MFLALYKFLFLTLKTDMKNLLYFTEPATESEEGVEIFSRPSSFNFADSEQVESVFQLPSEVESKHEANERQDTTGDVREMRTSLRPCAVENSSSEDSSDSPV